MTNKIIQPNYTTTLPSNGSTISYRPFTVIEEKALLLALQEDNINTTTEAIKNVVYVCTYEKVDPAKYPYYDIEYLYLQIRSKSIGEIIDLIGSCDCDETAKTPFSVDIDDIYLDPKPNGNVHIKIPDTKYFVEFRHPSIDDFALTMSTNVDASEQVVSNCIVRVYTEEENMEWSPKEKLEFVQSMTTKQQKDIANFLRSMPLVKIDTKYNCIKCGKEHTSYLSGYESFFV